MNPIQANHQRSIQQKDAFWREEAQRVSRARQKAAPRLGQAVTQAMQQLGMAGGRFEVALIAQDEAQAFGLESVELRVAGHAGSTPRPLAKVASGGELSRLALAIAVGAAIALIRFKANILLVILACALAGLVRLALPGGA